ncbi:arsenite efflux ATP-binding protein ArsA [Kineothrix alysoides]|uniref:arsenite-transporting ATPase n=1 Tax=Kineothrix alysoides TaxID=1469948 RepID=A0A4R1QR82_9FIRM|nr:ArsA family ATPase [Kineothrix alysoides]TCL56308.1 arsenite efflux ATP-binding protein ArsA [Kineothrix alysoides]
MVINMRVILYTGKGGVGKTSVAGASALLLAQTGKKVLVMSTDMAHSLGDSLDVKLGKEPKAVAENLDAMEIDVVYESEKSWGHLKNYMKQMLTLKGDGGIEVEELLVFPGMEELFSMFKILDYYEQGQYDVIVVDCAPTGETLSLLKYPEMLSDFMAKVLPIKRKGAKYAGPVVEKLMKMPMPKDNVFDDIEYIMDKMDRLQKLMLNKEAVSLRIVTTPEKIVIQEAKRNFTCLHLYNYNVDAIIVNRIYPEDAMMGYFSKWIVMQKEGLDEIRESFAEVPKFYLELQKGELRTLPILEEAGKKMFAETDIAEVLFCREIFKVIKTQDGTALKIYLPFAEKSEMDLRQNGNEIILSIKNQTRRFIVPQEFGNKTVSSAKFENGYLMIQ